MEKTENENRSKGPQDIVGGSSKFWVILDEQAATML